MTDDSAIAAPQQPAAPEGASMDAFATLILAISILVTLDLAALRLGHDSRELGA